MLSDIELTILSLVAEGARYGAEIEQVIEQRGLREWLTVGSASVYYILGRLEQQELLTSSQPTLVHGVNGGTDPARTIYQITDAGRGVAQTAVADLLCQPRAISEGFAVGLANSSVLKPGQVYYTLVHHRDRLTQQLHAAEAHQNEEHAAQPEGAQALFSYSIAIMRAELDWLSGFLEDWRARHPVIDEEDKAVVTGAGDDSARTLLHHATASSDRGKQLQQMKRPVNPLRNPVESPREE
jgi:DNA-binding PadR family transcriptional regulator